MLNPLISIITPVYNGADYIAEAIESALAQSYPNFELLIVNDGSTDHSCDVISPFLKDKRIHYFKKKNGGVASARNFALSVAKGDYIGFLDQDDKWYPDKLITQVAFLESHPSVSLHYARQEIINEKGTKLNYDWPTGATGHCLNELFHRNQITVLTVLVRKSVIDEVGRFNEELSGTDDYEMWLRITLKHPIYFLDSHLAAYRIHSENVSHDSFKMTVNDLKTINTFLLAHPEASSLVDKKTIHSRLFELNFQLGGWYSWKENNFFQARKHYFNAIKNKPLFFRSYYRWFYCALSDNLRKNLNWYCQKFKHQMTK